ncbi:MAG: hypothetical protein AAF485_25820, partial [Chloroflexota bacterium]
SEKEEKVAEITTCLNEIPLGAWRWPAYPTRFYAKGGAFCYITPNGVWEGTRMYTVMIGARTEHPLIDLKPLANEHWVMGC